MLRQVAVLLERENQRLHDRLQQLTTELAQLRGQDAGAAQIQMRATFTGRLSPQIIDTLEKWITTEVYPRMRAQQVGR